MVSALSAGTKISTTGRTLDEGKWFAEAMANRNPSKHRLHSPRHTSVKLYACEYFYFCDLGLFFSVALCLSFSLLSLHCVFALLLNKFFSCSHYPQ